MARLLITGANRGIGARLVENATKMGHDIITHTRPGRGGDIQCELSEVGNIPDAFQAIEGHIDILLNNAGIIGPEKQSPLDMDFPGFSQTFAINTLAPLAIAQTCLPFLRQSNEPRILTVSSQMSWMGYRKSDRIAYRASKAAVNKVMQGLATDLEPEKIPVVLVDPGWVRTDMGGDEADNDPNDVAIGILSLANRLTIQDTGKFFTWQGQEREF